MTDDRLDRKVSINTEFDTLIIIIQFGDGVEKM